MHYTDYSTPQLQLHYITTTTTAAVHHPTSSSCVCEVTDQVTTATIETTPKSKIPTTFPSISGFAPPSVIHPPTSPIGFLFWNFRHRLVRYYWYWFRHPYLATSPTYRTSKSRPLGRRYWLLVTGLPINDVSKQNGRGSSLLVDGASMRFTSWWVFDSLWSTADFITGKSTTQESIRGICFFLVSSGLANPRDWSSWLKCRFSPSKWAYWWGFNVTRNHVIGNWTWSFSCLFMAFASSALSSDEGGSSGYSYSQPWGALRRSELSAPATR